MPAIYGDLKAASLETLSSNPSSSTAGRIWRNSTDGQIYVDDGTNKRALFRNDNLFVFGTNATAANNIRFHRAGSGILQFVLGSDATAEGSLATNLAQISARVENSTTSTKPSAGASGRLLFLTDTKSLVVDDGTTYQAVGTSVSTNYITNSTAESGTTGWATYADAAANPVDGTGGVPTATFTATTSSPLRGVQSFLYTPGALGNGASYDFTIDSADKGRVLQLSFDFAIGGTGYTDGLIQVWVYDITNSALIQPAPYQILNTSNNSYFRSSFQTSNSSVNYRVIIHQSTATSTYTLKFDNVAVGPQNTAVGAFIGDWTSYTPTLAGFGTATNINCNYRRVGSTCEVYGFFTAGTTTAVTAQIGLPSGLVSVSTITGGMEVGRAARSNSAASNNFILLGNPSATAVNFGLLGQASSPLVSQNASSIVATSDIVVFRFSVPIQGWGSTQVLGSDSDGRVCAAHVSGTSGSIPGSAWTDVKFSTTNWDTHGNYSSSTGLYTVTVSGYYSITTTIEINGSMASGFLEGVRISKVGYGAVFADAQRLPTTSSAAAYSCGGVIYAVAGETFKVQVYTDRGTPVFSSVVSINTFSIARMAGPNQIAASESVNGRYSGTSSAPSSAGTAITFTTKSFDSHSAYSGSTLTIPSPGKYQFNAGTAIAATSWTSGNTATLTITKNGTGVASQSAQNLNAGNNVAPPLSVSDVVQCNAGDTIQVIGQSNAGGTLSYQFTTYFSWSRVGN